MRRLYRGPAAYPGPMDRTTWVHAFITELQRLRPHLKTGFGTSRIALAMAAQAYDPAANPVAAARAVHERMGPPKT
jgi:hypothetical protein